MENKRPTLADPKEFALIKKIHYPQEIHDLDKVDQEELYDRLARRRTINQAR